MPGIKGRSGGKATTAEEKAKKSAAAQAREARRAKINATKGKLGDPVTYGDLLKSVQVDGELLQNERRAIEVQRSEVELQRAKDEAEQARGSWVLKTEKDKAIASIRDAWWREVQQVAGLALTRLSALPAETRAQIKAAVDAEVAQAAERVKSTLT